MEKGSCIETFPTEKWLRKRTVTTRVYAAQMVLLGIEYSVVYITLWVYIKTLVNTSNPEIIYSLASAAYLVSSILASFPIGKWVDRTRETKCVLIIGNGMIIIGNLMYSLPFSPYFLISGRFIAGVGNSLRSVVIGEVFRSYKGDESISIISMLGIFFGVGFLSAPAINIAFLKVKFNINTWRVTDANIAGIYMAVLFSILEFVIVLYASNLSKEFDMKGLEEENYLNVSKPEGNISEKSKLLGEKKENPCETPSFFEEMKNLLKLDIMLIMLLSCHFMYLVTTLDLWLPMIIVDVLKWSLLEVDVVNFSRAVIALLILIYFLYKKVSRQQLYYFFVCSMFANTFGLIILYIITFYHGNLILIVALWCISCFFTAIKGVAPLTFLPSCLAPMVPSTIQTSAENMRLAFSRLGSLIALLTSVYLFRVLKIFVIFHSAVLILELIMVLIRRKSLMKPNLK